MQKILVAIYDKTARELAGNMNAITLHRADATAIRMFTDVALSEGTVINSHPEDFQVIRLGYIEDSTNELTPDYAVILEGSAWAAMQQRNRKEA